MNYTGNLMLKVSGRPYSSLVAGSDPLSIDGYEIEPLFKGYQTTTGFSADVPADNWFLARPRPTVEGPSPPPPDGSPWDVAHRVAAAAGYSFYAEPDFVRIRKLPYAQSPTEGLNKFWPPAEPVNPAWHLYDRFTGFLSTGMRGDGIRIAHLDTGYSNHLSKPLHLRADIGRNFYEGGNNTVDPGTTIGWPPPQPGHGTATLALLAGNKLDMNFGGHHFNDYFGGAAESEVVPVRIGASVIHLWDSAMARGIDYALAPRGNAANRCDVITISQGGFPALSWAHAINHAYEAGLVVAAAAGDNEMLLFLDIPGHDSIWPSRFRRAITATGATYRKMPYVTDDSLALQGSYGPDDIMDKAIASYAPNTAWMKFDTVSGYDMNGGGTSASTPQIAAACSLWLQKNKAKYPADWRRVEACRQALFKGADKTHNHSPTSNKNCDKYFGQGLLSVPRMLEVTINSSELVQEPRDTVNSDVWQVAMDIGPATNDEELMFEVEAAQVTARARKPDLVSAVRNISIRALTADRKRAIRELLSSEPDVSVALKKRLGQH